METTMAGNIYQAKMTYPKFIGHVFIGLVRDCKK